MLDIAASCPGAQVGDQRWSAAKQDQRGAERQGANHLWQHHRHSAYGALERAGAVVAGGDGVGLLVAFADKGREGLEVFSPRSAADAELA